MISGCAEAVAKRALRLMVNAKVTPALFMHKLKTGSAAPSSRRWLPAGTACA